MVRYVCWLVNSALFTLCCFLIADTANAIIAALLSQPPPAGMEADPIAQAQSREWRQRQEIIDRNLFHSSTLVTQAGAAEAAEDLEELEETELPLKLWGTIASDDPAQSWASIEELDHRTTTAVQVGDEIERATVVGIERQRVVLLENGKRRSLSLDDVDLASSKQTASERLRTLARSRRTEARQPTARATRRTGSSGSGNSETGRNAVRDRIRQLAENRFEVEADDVAQAMNDPASLFSQARILPKIDPEIGVTGLEISAIQPGSIFEQIGIRNGELITQIDGVPIGDFEEHSQILAALTDDGGATITVEGPDGSRDLELVPSP